ncbi:MAG: glycosyltransferase family 4 protein [Bacteroidales bacterium]|nr:glycosyltransferase family 4 protein [Bacteroidales bacterium]
MKIGIVGYFNPYAVFGYFSEESKSKVRSVNETATAVNVLVKSFLNAGHQVVVFTGDHNAYEDTTLNGKQITVHVVGFKIRHRYLHFFILSEYSKKIRQCILKNLEGVEILHAQWTYHFADACCSFTDKVPIVCTARDWAPYVYSTVSGVKAKLLWLQKKWMSRRVLNHSKIHFVSNSYYTQQRIFSVHPDYEVPIIFNSIEDSYILRERDNYPQHNTFISISPEVDDHRKNCDVLIEAFSLFLHYFPGARLLMIGKVDFAGNLYQKWKKQNWLINVEFPGYVDHARLMELFDEVTCLVHPSLEETFGNILLEGMARRVPVIGGEKSGAVPFVLKQGKCGCLCDITNPESIMNAMMKIVTDKSYASSLVNNGTTVLLEEYSGSVVEQKHMQFYESIINSYL